MQNGNDFFIDIYVLFNNYYRSNEGKEESMNKKVKIFQIIPNLILGGAEIMVENLANALDKDKFDISIVSLYDYSSTITERLDNKNIQIYYLGKKKGFDVKIIYKLYKLFKREKPDVIHTHLYAMPYTTIAAILSNVPKRIHTIHSIASKEVGILKRRINYFFYKFCNVTPVSISPTVRDSVIEEYKLLENQVPMIYNGIDFKKCIPIDTYVRENCNLSIIHVGSFKEAKNHLDLIESFIIVREKNQNVILKLIGVGDLEKIIKQRVKEAGLEDCVEFLGSKSDVFPYLSKADIFILPSLWEGMPLSLIEAMGTGLPILATCVGGIPDVIQNNVSGLLVNTDKHEIARAILKLIDDCRLRERIGRVAKLESQRFSSQEMARNYEQLYE